jgi:tRNA-dihydrouridine synthase 3
VGFAEHIIDAVVMAPMTKGSNLPYRRLAVELGASVTMSEMTLARRLKQKRHGEFALIRRFADEPCFGVQLATNSPDEAEWAAAFVADRGADFVDMNFGCPIDYFTRRGLGAAIGRNPTRMHRIVAAMKRGAGNTPVTAKIRLGWSDRHRNYLEQARAVVDAGADALFVHGRTRKARYRSAADWESIGTIADAVSVPVIGNGDLLFPHEIAAARRIARCAGVMVARAALIKPWIFREVRNGYWDITAEERVTIYRRYATLAREHWGDDEHGVTRARAFIKWHLDFWCRYAPRAADGRFPTMQGREGVAAARSALDALLAREDELAFEYIADCLVHEREIQPADAPRPDVVEAGHARGRSDVVDVEG